MMKKIQHTLEDYFKPYFEQPKQATLLIEEASPRDEIEGLETEAVERDNEDDIGIVGCENNDVTLERKNKVNIEGSIHKKEIEKSSEISEKMEEKSENEPLLSVKMNECRRVCCFTNDLTFVLFSVSCFVQVE